MVVDPEPGISQHLIFLTGNIVTWWGRIEYLFTTDLLKLVGKHDELKQRKEFDVIQIASKRRITQWARAHRIMYQGRDDVLDEVDAIATEAREILEDRNILIHGMWHVFGQNEQGKVKITHMEHAKGEDGMKLCHYTVTEREIDEINSRAYRLYHRLIQLDMNLTFSFGGQVRWSIKGKDD